ncbi:MAG: alpha-amylase family glycosyl hydrolase [Oscillospiraceae bacterium]|nr:alpha-amylase family glycosyl hydrolase [Oscillospiraceae bacterium]
MSYWFENAVIYHIYPFGYCGCPRANSFLELTDGETPNATETSPILRVIKHIPVLKKQGFNALYIGPVFESTRHGYDTADYMKIDSRLGTNEDFALVCRELKQNGIKVVLDGVFNHVGRDFWAFKDVRKNGLASRYSNWFHLRSGNSGYNDGFFYEGWEGHYDLVKLNLHNPEVKAHLKEAVTKWYNWFGIDGLRLDVAYCLDANFLKELRVHCKALKPDFWLMGETLHGDYNKWLNPEMLDSVTNYECYKGLFSSFNSLNMFEIAHSLNRQFGSEHWCLYRGKQLYCFVDNHDVSRIASALTNPKHLTGIYTLLFTMPGIPGVYYGSEYGIKADKKQGDDALRPEFDIDDYYIAGEETSRSHSSEPEPDTGAASPPSPEKIEEWEGPVCPHCGKHTIKKVKDSAAKDLLSDIKTGNFVTGDSPDMDLPQVISKLAKAHATLKPLQTGDYKQVVLQNQYYAFSRSCGGETVYALINAGSSPAGFNLGGSGKYADALSGEILSISEEIKLPPYGAAVLFRAK